MSHKRDVEAYFSILRSYYDLARDVVARHGGRIAQHQGDGIFVWFGYPAPQEDDAARAVRAALELLVVLRNLSGRLEAAVGEPLGVRVAVHVGEVLIASIEDEQSPSAFGHTPNVAAKLQHAALPGTLVVSGEVARQIEGSFTMREREAAVLADGSIVTAYEVLSERSHGRMRQTWRTPLVGRERERRQLHRSWASVQAGGNVAVALVGPPGIGKTRLASTLGAEATATARTVLDCACNRLDGMTAYRPFRALLAQAAGTDPGAPPTVNSALLEDYLHGVGLNRGAATILGAMLGRPGAVTVSAGELDPTRVAQITAELLVEWIVRISTATPTILFVDDVAHADPSSLAVLGQLVAIRPPRLLLVFTARSDDAQPPFLQSRHVETIQVEPLPWAASAALVDAVAVTSQLATVERDWIVQQAEGVPLYLEELAWAAQEMPDERTLPTSLQGRLQVRLAAPDVDHEVANALAVARDDIDEAMLASVLGIGHAEVHNRLRGLLARDLVVQSGPTGSSYRFRHGLLADAAYMLVLVNDRTDLHRRLAEAMSQRHRAGLPVDWNVVSHHLRQSGQLLDAYEAILTAADEARRHGAFVEALRAYGDALAMLTEVTEPGVRDVLEVRGRLERGATAVAARGFGADEAVEDFDRCAQLCRKLGPRPEHVSAMSGVYAFYLLQGQLDASRRVAEDLRSWVEAGHAEHGPGNVLGFAVLSFFAGDYAAAIDQLRRAVNRFGAWPLDAPSEQNWLLPFDLLVVALSHLAAAQWIAGRPREAQAAGDRAIARAAKLAFPEGPFSMAYAKSYLAWMYALGGHHQTAARLATEVRDIGRQHGFAYWESTGEIHLALAEYRLRGRPDAAETVALHASIWESLRARAFLPYVLAAAADTRVAAGQLDEAVDGFMMAGALVKETGVEFYEAERLRLLAAALVGSLEVSLDTLGQAWELAHRQGALLFELRAALDLVRRTDQPRWFACLRELVKRFPPGAGYPELTDAHALLARASSQMPT
jgi:class 3 adenylate cyclase/tetratricopeptide (TPR) repeat protein